VLEARLGAERAVLSGAGHSLPRAPGYNEKLVALIEPDSYQGVSHSAPAALWPAGLWFWMAEFAH
jgi:hypothetical protein